MKEANRLYLSFDYKEFAVNKGFKKQISPNGSVYEINEILFEFPSKAAVLLKYKKHEWVIIAFENEKNVYLIWPNKGLTDYMLILIFLWKI